VGVVASARVALRALRVNVLRSVLTTLGIIIGVGALITMISVGEGARARIAEQIRRMGANVFYIIPGSVSSGGVRLGHGTRTTLTTDDATAIAAEIPFIQAVAPATWANSTQVVFGNMNWSTNVQGTSPAYETAREWPIVAGSYFSDEDVEAGNRVAILGQTVVANLFGNTDPVGQIIRMAQVSTGPPSPPALGDAPAEPGRPASPRRDLGVTFTVLGVLERKGHNSRGQDTDDMVLIPITTMRRVIGSRGAKGTSIDGITVKVRDGEDMQVVERQIRQLFRQRHQLQPFQDDDFRILSMAEMLLAEEESTRTFTMLLGAIASVSLIVGGIGIMNIMLVSVTERTREIGIRMTVGARKTDILIQFLVEAVTLALVGGVLGIAAGIIASYVISYLAEWRTLIDSRAIIIAFAFSALVGVFFGLYPARRAALLNPIDALRYE
jgi:putative ABC transport system permease protein